MVQVQVAPEVVVVELVVLEKQHLLPHHLQILLAMVVWV
tara:strand:+ start:184 stop:300 length:117 start_codon:yes stop_codon:yes gene_type:complete